MAIPLVASPPTPVDPNRDLISGDSSNFAASVGAWVMSPSGGTMTRDTSVKMPGFTASLKHVANAGAYVEVPLLGPFLAGKMYTAMIWVAPPPATTFTPSVYLGQIGTDATGPLSLTIEATGTDDFVCWMIQWTPSANRASATLRIGANPGATYYVGWARAWQTDRVPLLASSQLGDPRIFYPLLAGYDSTGLSAHAVNGFSGLRMSGRSLAYYESQGGLSGIDPATADLFAYAEHAPGDLTGDGVNIEAGVDYVGIDISEKDSSTAEISPDGGTDAVELRDQNDGWYSSDEVGGSRFRLNNVSHGLFGNTVPVAIVNTEAVVVGADVLARFAGTWWPTLHVRAYGRLTTGATGGSSIFRVRIGPTTLTGAIVATLTVPNSPSVTNAPFVLDIMVNYRGAGDATTPVIGNISVMGGSAGPFTVPVEVSAISATVDVDDTVDNRIEVTYVSGNAGSTATFEHAVIGVIDRE